MAGNGLRTQYPYARDALSPRPLYDFPSPTSNYPSGIGGASPGFYPMAYNISPRFGGSAFIPPADVFYDGRKGGSVQENGAYPPSFRKRSSEALDSDPVAMHLLVETAITDSQNFDILSVEEVQALKQEQKGLDGRLGSVRRKLESETKIRDAARSLNRLTSRKEKGHQRGFSSRGSNAVKDTFAKSEEDLNASNRKVGDLTRELLEIESRMRLIDMQLLMHTAAVLQLTHNGPNKRNQNSQMSNGSDRRPDSPASIYTYENERSNRTKGEDGFDERSFYRSPENLDSLMHALQNGIHHHSESVSSQSQALNATSRRLEELNERLRDLIVQANPERNQQYALPPQAPVSASDASSLDRQLDFLDQGLRDMRAEQATPRNNAMDSEVEGRLEGINNQLYAMLSNRSEGEKLLPPMSGSGAEEQLNYMEDSFYNIEQLQYSLNEQIDELRSRPATNQDIEKYETTLMGLWQIILAGEEEARERKRERRRLIAEDPENDEELSPDEDYNPREEFSLAAFSAKVQWLFSRATSLKDKQGILLRQIKQQRELNSKSDAQKEAEFARLNEQVLSARSEKKTMETELERAMGQLSQFDEQKVQSDSRTLREAQELSTNLSAQLREVEQRNTAYENQLNAYESQIHDAQERALVLENQLREAQDDARVEAATIQAELAASASKIDEATAALATATAAKQDAENRATDAATALTAKENELRDLESEVVRLTTELTFAKAELDGAYGTRAERAAESGGSLKKELEDLTSRNAALTAELEALKKASDAASTSEQQARESERTLKAELGAMAAEYEALTRDAIQNEKDRDTLEASIDKLRDEKESLEMELSDEKVKWLGIRSPSVAAGATGAGGVDMGATSIRMLREDFRKMMRDRTAEGLRALRAEQEERRKLEALVRQLRKDALPPKSNLSKTMTA